MTNPTPSSFAFVRKFNPVVTRSRHDGWTPERQAKFIDALAASGCVADACRSVGLSTESAYQLRARYEATDFRLTWEAALAYAVQRLSDAALSRAIHGAPVPHYYKGQAVGEHRRFNENLTMFILRYRDPLRYARHWDRQAVVGGHPEQEAERLALGRDCMAEDVSRKMYERENAVLREAADLVSDADARRLVDIQERKGVRAAVAAAEVLAAARDREDAAEEAAWRAAEAAGTPGEDDAARANADRDTGGGAGATRAAARSAEAEFDAAEAEADAALGEDESGDGDAFRFDVASTSSTSAPDYPFDFAEFRAAPGPARASGAPRSDERGPGPSVRRL